MSFLIADTFTDHLFVEGVEVCRMPIFMNLIHSAPNQVNAINIWPQILNML